MKSNDILLLLVVGILGYVVVARLTPAPQGPSTATSNPTGGTAAATAGNPLASISNMLSSAFNFVGSLAQTQPKTL